MLFEKVSDEEVENDMVNRGYGLRSRGMYFLREVKKYISQDVFTAHVDPHQQR